MSRGRRTVTAVLTGVAAGLLAALLTAGASVSGPAAGPEAAAQSPIPVGGHPFHPTPSAHCRTVLVRIEPGGRYLVTKAPWFPPPLEDLQWQETDASGLRAVLAAYPAPPPHRGPGPGPVCPSAQVIAAGNAPMSALRPAFEALRSLGHRHMAGGEDAAFLQDDPGWRR